MSDDNDHWDDADREWVDRMGDLEFEDEEVEFYK